MDKSYGSYDMSHYKKNTLANVIFRIDFAEKNNIAEANLMKHAGNFILSLK